MKESVKLWIEALRSGKYRQGKGQLNVKESMCCLGVACELFIQNGGTLSREVIHGDDVRYGGDDYYTPKAVKEWLGLRDQRGDFGGVFEGKSLSSMNDNGQSFAQIADLIESNPPGLFYEDKEAV